MTERDALLAGIRANPDDDLPRLVFADWLEEQGNNADGERAEFIRAQIAMAGLYPYTLGWMKLHNSTNKLLKKHDASWGTTGASKVVHRVFERGFLHGVTIYAKSFVKNGAELFDSQPIRAIRFVKLNSARGSVPMSELVWCPHLSQATKLDFTDSELSPSDLAALGTSPHAMQVRSVTMGGSNPLAADASLASVLNLPALSELSLYHNRSFGHEALAILGGDFGSRQLRKLDLTGTSAAVGGLSCILKSPHLGGIEELRMDNGLVDETVQVNSEDLQTSRKAELEELSQLIATKPMPNLKVLSLSLRGLNWTDAKLLAKAAHWPKLEYLNLSANTLGIRGVEELATAPFAAMLKVLDLRYNNLDPEQVERSRAMFPNAEVIG